MQTALIISLEEFPEEGMRLQGELDAALFDIDSDALQSIGPLVYDLEAHLYDTELMLRGSISALFRLRCDRCLDMFDYEVWLDDFVLSADVKGKLSYDATEEMREEIVLALPSYPKCELTDKECQINDEFSDFRLDKDPHLGVNSGTPSGQSVWDALDAFSNHDRQ